MSSAILGRLVEWAARAISSAGRRSARGTGARSAVVAIAHRPRMMGSQRPCGLEAQLAPPVRRQAFGSARRGAPALIIAIGLGHFATLACGQSVIVSTFAGSGASGSANGTGTAASFNHPFGVAVDGSGNVYVADSTNDTVRKITSAGVVSTFAGQTGVTGTANGTGTAASFNYPVGVAIDGSGNVYMTDFTNEVIRKITSAGVVSTFAGQAGVSGSANGTGTAASFKGPSGIAVDASGNVYVGDQLNCTVRKITPAGVVSTLAGQAGVTGSANGIGTAATFNSPFGVVVDGSGNVYVADYYNYMIRKITSAGVVSTLAGQAGVTGSANGTGTAATFNDPNDVLLDGSGNVYVSDQLNGTIRKIHSRPIAANTAA